MSNIPPDLYQQLHELTLRMTNAAVAGDDVLYDSLYQSLLALHEETSRLGQSHPFLTEALADYSEDPAASMRYYELALAQARQFPDEPIHTKMISPAAIFIKLGQLRLAEACLRDGRAEAVRRGDSVWIDEADMLLRECQG